jgi:hypothetical protein
MNFYFFENFTETLIQDLMIFYNSSFFWVIKILLAIYTIVLFLDIILLVIQRNVVANVREGFSIGMNIPPELTTQRKKLKDKWKKIKEKLKSQNEADYKLAIIEADDLIGGLIEKLGFNGDNMAERLDNIPAGQLDDVESLQTAHQTRNRIIHEENMQFGKEEAQKTLELYEKFLDYFEVLN